jgi:hypothetical protein
LLWTNTSPSLQLTVSGGPILFHGTSNGPAQRRIFVTMAHLYAKPFYLTVDTGSRWPWIYVAGERHCFTFAAPHEPLPCPDVPVYDVSQSSTGKHLNTSGVSLVYGAGVFSANASIAPNAGFFSDVLSFAAATGDGSSSSSIPIKLATFIGINQVALNTPILELLGSGVLGFGPPCFRPNDTYAPCEPFFLGEAQRALGFAKTRFEFDLDVGERRGSTSVGSVATAALASGSVTLGRLLAPDPYYTWQPVSKYALAQGLWWIDLEYAVGDAAFSPCNMTLVDTAGGPTEIPTGDRVWKFGRNCSGINALPTYRWRLPANGAVLTMTPDDYIIRFWNTTSQRQQCESSVLFAESVEEDDGGGGGGASGGVCVLGMWTATKYSLSFDWSLKHAAVGFRRH